MVFWRTVFRARRGGNTEVSSTARRRPSTPAPTRTLFARRRCATVYVGVPYFYCTCPPAVIDRRCSRPAAATAIPFSPVPRKLTVARVRQSQSSLRPINTRTPSVASYPTRIFLGHRFGSIVSSGGSRPPSEYSRVPFRRPRHPGTSR